MIKLTNILGKGFKSFINIHGFPNLDQAVIELDNFRELQKVFKWDKNPILDRPDIYDFEYLEDVNERRIRDAESLAVVVRNIEPHNALEIGTANGMSTVLMSSNSPKSNIYTVNIPPEEILSGKGGTMTTIALEHDKIGLAFREKNIKNITQILANTATWVPNIGIIDFAYIDGCHDSDFVFNDTKKVLAYMKPGSFILWHDFNLNLAKKYKWINSVCLGIENLFKKGLLHGRIFQIKNSWTGIYRI
jgi:predicted O-methyltransferase YrrM